MGYSKTNLSDNKGKSLMISTPNGINWFHELFENQRIEMIG